MKIRVLHVIDHLGYGGAPLVVKGLVEAMPAERIESVVCALRPNPRPIDIRAKVVTLDCHKYSPAAVRVVPRLCAEHGIDIVHAHLQKAVMSTLLAARSLQRPLIVHEHGPIFRGGTGCIYRGFLRRWGSRAQTIVANSQAAALAMRRVLSCDDVPVIVVPNSVDLYRFDPARYERAAIRSRLGLNEGEFAIGFIGRLDRAKGADLLVDAAQQLKEQGESCRVFLFGQGGQQQALEQQVRRAGLEQTVIFAGLTENPAEVMSAFDVAVVPSRREAFGIAALEWMRMSVPVIVSPVGGLPELIQPGRTGLVLPELTAHAIAEAIQSLRADPSWRATLAQAAFDRAGAFGVERPVTQIVDIYEEICEPRSQGR